MKKQLLKNLRLRAVMLVALLCAGISGAWGEESVYKTVLFGGNYNSKSVSNYTSDWSATNNGFTVNISKFNNNSNQWSYIKCGNKNDASVGIITTSSAVDKAIVKVVVKIDAITTNSVNSIKLYTSNDNSQWSPAGTFSISTGEQSVSINNPTANLYYKIEFDCKKGSSNGLITVSKIQFYYDPSKPSLSADNVDLTYNATSGTIGYVINNPVEGGILSATTTDDWLTIGNVGENPIPFTCTTNESSTARTATVKLTYTYGSKSAEKDVTITQFGIDFATLPFTFDGGKSQIENTVGLSQSNLGNDYSASPYLKFDDKDDNLILKFNERPGVLTFDIKGNSFASGTFKVQTSADGTNYTDLKSYSYTQISSTTQTETFTNLAENIRYIKWILTQKGSGNIALGNINLTKYVAPKTLTIANPENVTITATYNGDEIINNGDVATIANGTEITLALSIAEGYMLKNLTVSGAEDGQTVTVIPHPTTVGIWTFKMPSYNATVNAEVERIAYTTYTLASAITSGKRYIITDGNNYAMGQQNSSNRAAVAISIIERETSIASTAGVYEFVIEKKTDNSYSIYDETTRGYLYAASNNNNHLKTKEDLDNNGLWTIVFDQEGIATITAQGDNTRNIIRFNSNNDNAIFSCYASGQQNVYIYEKVESDTQTSTFTISKNCIDSKTNKYYGTFSNSRAFVVPSDMTVSTITVTGGILNVNDLTAGTIVPANTGVMVSSSTYGAKTVNLTTETGTALANNMLKPTGAGITSTQMTEANSGCKFYYLTMNGDQIGFWWRAADGAAFDMNVANKAYLAVPATQAGNIKSFSFNDVVDGIKAAETTETENNAIYNLAGQRVSKMQKGIYVVNGKKILVK
ncbi:MAG: hypothetical protein IJL35_00790 [Bacteroidaceae bacterium]|nr:hypothetical protein [Bacteroidaceae bacterium]